MLDFGTSTLLTYKGESLVGYTPRPVPHVVTLASPPQTVADPAYAVASQKPTSG